jgi:hypothetical protein
MADPKYAEVVVWISLDESGDYGIGSDSETAERDHAETKGVGDYHRVICVTIKVPIPQGDFVVLIPALPEVPPTVASVTN